MSFDTIYYPGISVKNANKYNIFKEPYYFNEINKLCNSLQGTGDNYISNYYLNINPVKDNNPYYSRFLKWRKMFSVSASRL